MYIISTIRSIIDYAAPVLLSLLQKSLQPLEGVQNDAMRTIFGCARTTRREMIRMELYLPSIQCRIKELIISAAIRMTRRGGDALISFLNTFPVSKKHDKYKKEP